MTRGLSLAGASDEQASELRCGALASGSSLLTGWSRSGAVIPTWAPQVVDDSGCLAAVRHVRGQGARPAAEGLLPQRTHFGAEPLSATRERHP